MSKKQIDLTQIPLIYAEKIYVKRLTQIVHSTEHRDKMEVS